MVTVKNFVHVSTQTVHMYLTATSIHLICSLTFLIQSACNQTQ